MDQWNPYGAGPRQFGSIVRGVFTPVLAKHSNSFNLVDIPAVGKERIQFQTRRLAGVDRWFSRKRQSGNEAPGAEQV